MEKLKCWVFQGCGKDRIKDCPVYTNKFGHSCWRVAGTMCGGKAQGIFAEKLGNCKICDFFIYMNVQ
jgi:methyl-accepting chemotaxis protein